MTLKQRGRDVVAMLVGSLVIVALTPWLYLSYDLWEDRRRRKAAAKAAACRKSASEKLYAYDGKMFLDEDSLEALLGRPHLAWTLHVENERWEKQRKDKAS